jgi:hypothetical protein
MKTLRNCFVSLFLVSALSFAANRNSHTPTSQWIAGNSSIQIVVDEKSGTIIHLIDQVSHEDYCNQSLANATADTDGNRGVAFTVGPRIGGLVLFDELRNQVFGDLSDSGTVTHIMATPASLSFDKQYPGAEFVTHETFRVSQKDVRWDVRLTKISGPDRTVRVVYDVPMPLGGTAWAPISDAPFRVKPWLPFSIDYGQSTSGAIGEGRWRTTIPLMVFYSKHTQRALAIASPLEIPAVRIRFLSNTGALADFYWNSREYPARERPYFQVSNEDLGLRGNRDLQTGLLISTQPADWRPALGWFYAKYKDYFDPNPNFEKWDGAYGEADSFMEPSMTPQQVSAAYAKEFARGVRWEEYHSPYAHYGLMIPPKNVKSWVDVSDPGGPTLTRAKVEEHCKMATQAGVGTFLYYNTTESEYWYAQQNFPESIAKSEADRTIDAWRGETYPGKRACWLMNSDPGTKFGQSMIDEAKQMVEAYPDAAGFFWDVYGRSYMFDFAHDDGITMVDNKPAYYPEFMYQRLMDQSIGPLLHDRGMTITANKPVTVASTRGVDGIMMMEDAPHEENPGWIAAQSYLGLTRHVMILDGDSADTEMLYLHCLRYGAFNSMPAEATKPPNLPPPERIAYNRDLEKKYQPFVNLFAGKKWIFYPQALELPENVYGNIFQLKNGDVMITMVSAWRALRHAEGYDMNLKVVARLPNAADVRSVEVDSVDLGEKTSLAPQRQGDQLAITVPKHGKATVILLHMKS